MWPYVIEHPIRIGTYGVMMATGFLTALWIMSREFARRNIHPKHAENTVFLGIVFGVIGAKLAYMFTEAQSVRWTDFFSGAGLTWHGGLILATAAIVGYYILKKIPVLVAVDALSPTLASGYAFGRLGCQLSGDGDYGIACGDLVDRAHCMFVDIYNRGFEACLAKGYPGFCMSYPDGIVPTTELVHPTPVYEAVNNFLLAGFLWSIRKRIKTPGVLFAIYLIGSGILRFLIEMIRQEEGRPYRFLGLRDASLVALASVAVGLVLWAVVVIKGAPAGQEYGVLAEPIGEKGAGSGAVPSKKKRGRGKKRH